MGVITTSISGSAGFQPSVALTGSLLVSSGFVSALGFGNASTFDTSLNVPANYNFVLIGPITISSGIELKIDSGANVAIKSLHYD
jgi:hypothetical protein